MKLNELTSELFIYLVVFRRKIAAKADLTVEGVGDDLEMIFARMDKKAEENPALDERYRRIRNILVVIADGIVIGSDWDRALDYRMGQLLENKYYQTNKGGDYFFDELNTLPAEAMEEREIFFTALALGFQGRHAHQPEIRMDLKKKLYRGLPEKVVDAAERLTPSAYEHTDERDCTVPPVARFGRYAIMLAGILLFFLLLGRTIYHSQKNEIEDMVKSLPKTPLTGTSNMSGKNGGS